MADKVKVAIAGASGYTGGELTRLLLDHPCVELTLLSSERHAGQPIGLVHPGLRNHPRVPGLRFRALDELERADVVFAALPQGALPARMPILEHRAARLLNLGGDYRLRDGYEIRQHYPKSLGSPLNGSFAYYIPELLAPPASAFVSLPGCMAVATLYALYPLFAEDLAEVHVVADVKTGSSGGGRRGGDGGEHPAERVGNFRVHKLHGHRHCPEICQALTDLTGVRPELQFSTHSFDMPRGVVVTAYARLRPGVAALDVKRAFARAYAGRPFVRVRTAPKTPQDYPMLKAVVGSNVAEIAMSVRGDRCVAVAALDNLIKGAAGQAVQAMNLIFGFAETTGLPFTAVSP